MKVLFFCTSLSRSAGGLFSALTGLAKALADRGIDIGAVGGADAFFEQDRNAWHSVRLHPYPLGWSRYAFDARALAALRRHRPDLVHVHGIWGPTSIYGRAATAMGIPTVVSPHGMLDPWILARRPFIKKLHAFALERPLLRRAWIHALNDAERGAVTAFLPAAGERTFVVPNGVPPEAPPPGGVAKGGALFLGRLHSKKQVVELIRTWRSLPQGERLTVAGWGAPEYEAEVRRAAEGAANVEVVGALHGEAKTTALSRARFFILPSLSEGLPMAVLEAIAHGCIPVVTPQCNLPELFRDGIALRMDADFSDFAAVMGRARGFSEAELASRSAAAVAYARHYAWPVIAGTMIGHYERILAHAGAR